jgi:hypothetical protein
MDMENFVGRLNLAQATAAMQKTGGHQELVFPVKAEMDETLPEATLTRGWMNGHEKWGEVVIRVFNRKVESVEKITVPAGEFECIKISSEYLYDLDLSGNKLPLPQKLNEWFHPELGMIQSELINQEGKRQNLVQLISVVKPAQ